MLRLELSPLRAHKHRYNFQDTSDPLCIVCKVTEDTKHYLLHCKSFRLARVSLMQEVSSILGFNISTLSIGRTISILLCWVMGKYALGCIYAMLIMIHCYLSSIWPLNCGLGSVDSYPQSIVQDKT